MSPGNQVKGRRMAKLLIALLIGSFAGGCAFGTRHVTLRYPPETNMGELGVAHAAASPVTPGSETRIVFVRFNDLRFDKNRIGNVQNAYGMDTADVVADNDVSEWVNNAIISGLEEYGYKVVGEEELDTTNNLPVLMGEILSVYVTAYLSYEAEVALIAELQLDKKVIMRESYNKRGSVGLNWAMTADSAGESLSLALADTVRQIVHDVNAQLSLVNNP